MKCALVLLLLCALMMNSSLFSKDENTSTDSQYWYHSPEGERIEFEPIDGEFLLEFSPDADLNAKSEVVSNYGNTHDLSLQNHTTDEGWSLDDEVIYLQGKLGSAKVAEILKKQAILGILPRLRDKATGEIVDFRPATFDIVFSQNIPEAEIRHFLERHHLKLRSDPVSNFYSYYVLRCIHVEIPLGEQLFSVIHSIVKEPEVKYAFPLMREGRKRLSRMPLTFCCIGHVSRVFPPYVNIITFYHFALESSEQEVFQGQI